MVIVDTVEALNELFEHMRVHDFVVDIVMSDCHKHPCVNDVSIILVQFVSTEQLWVFPMIHMDVVVPFSTLKQWYKLFVDEMRLSIARKFVFDKKSLYQLFGEDFQLIDVNLESYLQTGSTIDVDDIKTNTQSFVSMTFPAQNNVNRYIPLCKHAAIFQEKVSRIEFSKIAIDDKDFKFINNVALLSFAKLESMGLQVDESRFESSFGKEHISLITNGRVYSQYNLFTATGRPSNRFGGVNFAALNKEDESRKSFVSRHGKDGMLVMIDYSAFHPRLIARLANYDLPMDVNPYEYFAKDIYKTSKPNPSQIASSKVKFFQQLYGGIRSDLLEVPYFKAVQTYIDHRWSFFEINSYVETPLYFRRIKTCHIDIPTPNKLFNYILQAYETEVAVQTLERIIDFLKDKKSVPILYTYDSLLYDFHRDDGRETLTKIKNIMVDNLYPVKVFAGKNYDEMERIAI